MEKPTLVKKSKTWTKEKNGESLRKMVWEYNSGQFETTDIAKIKISGIFPEKGWHANEACLAIIYCTKGPMDIELKSGETYKLEKEDVMIIPRKTWCKIKSEVNEECEYIMTCTPAWYKEQSKILEE